jgi:Spy/CpxP family protein refolding chaperone
MDRVRKNSWLVRGAALAIFILGFAAGALAPAAYRAWTRGDGGGGDRRDRLERMSEDLNLSPEQKEQVRQIFAETRTRLEALRKESEPRFAEIRRETDERLKQTLTPEQWEEFRKSRAEGRGRRGRGKGGGDGQPRER